VSAAGAGGDDDSAGDLGRGKLTFP
jgi:hypothetical protein